MGAMNAVHAEEWFVSDGDKLIGPVTMELLAKGIANDKVPLDALVRRGDWNGWKRAGEIPELRAGEGSGVRRTAVSRDVAAIAEATTIGEAALYVLATCISELDCEGGLVHLYDPRTDAFKTKCANGPQSDEVLGAVTSTGDLAMVALASGDTLDEWAQGMVASRLRALGVSTGDTIALPLRAYGDMIGAIELGGPRGRVAFSASDVAFVERVAYCLARRLSGEIGA